MLCEPTAPIAYGRRVAELATLHPDKPAIYVASATGDVQAFSWQQLDRRSNQFARAMAAHGAGQGSMVVIGLPNGFAHYVAAIAAWKLGACTLPLRYDLPARERDPILALAQPGVVVADWRAMPVATLDSAAFAASVTLSDAPHPERIAHPGKAIGSGGSTGRPKIIVEPGPWVRVPGAEQRRAGFDLGQIQLVAGALYHNAPFSWSHYGLFDDQTLVVMERFDAVRAIELIERYRVNWLFLAPTMMRRIVLALDGRRPDFSSLEGLFHSAAPCPAWLKRAWIDLIGPTHVYEIYGSTEDLGSADIRGDEWLEHPGSVGRPSDCDLRIRDPEGRDLPPGAVGEIYTRRWDTKLTYAYLGAPPAKTAPDGFSSVGDLGWLDEQGYLYLADRRVDLIISGGANVYPAEVEAALSEHIAIEDVAVIGVPDEEWGRRVHAVVQLRPDRSVSVSALDLFCRERLVAYKVPKSYEFIAELPREPSGKIRRSALVAEREQCQTPAMVAVAAARLQEGV